jgi:hypothetical protein
MDCVESSNGKNIISPDGKYIGAFQFDAATAKKYDISDRTDELQEEIGFARYMRDLHNQTGDWEKSLAMFDGDTHVSGDEKTYGGDWKRGAKPETLNYLDYFKTHGVDLSDGAAVRTAGSKAYKSPATADGGQANPGYNFTLPKPAANPQMTPVQINVAVSQVPGASANISVGGITQ